MDLATLKLKLVFADELDSCADNGKLDLFLYNLIFALCRTWHGDTQHIEGLNSKIKYEVRSAPSISLQLCSARVAVKHVLGAGGGKRTSGRKSRSSY